MLNLVILIGRLTKDPVLRQTKTGYSVTSFSLAVNNGFGENQSVDFINIVAWRNLAENICKYVGKGSLVAVEGRIQTNIYESNDGIKREQFEVLASNVKFLDNKNKGTIDNKKNFDEKNQIDELKNNFVEKTKEISNDEYIKNDIDEDTFDITDDDLPF